MNLGIQKLAETLVFPWGLCLREAGAVGPNPTTPTSIPASFTICVGP